GVPARPRGAGGGGGHAPGRAARRDPGSGGAGPAPRLPVHRTGPDDRGAGMNTHGYTCRVTNWKLFGLLAALCAVPLAVWAVVPRHPVGLLVCAVVLALVSVVFSSVGLAVGPRGVTVRLGPVGWPAARIARERITDARAVTLPATRVGGWGLHYSPWRG